MSGDYSEHWDEADREAVERMGDDCNDPEPTIAKCWNCGGHVFDEHGQCLYCCEPNVIERVADENPEQPRK